MIRITDTLTTEHATLRTLFSKVEGLLPGLTNLGELRLLVALLEQVLHKHEEDEENLFFGALHQTVSHIKELEELSVAHGKLDKQLSSVTKQKDLEAGKKALVKALAAIRQHFNFEESDTFPKIKERLGKHSLKALGGAWLNDRSHL